ncbi:MAG: TlyA family RNA methyltransferase [Ruminiclostridium sp.]|nr:TlyA family RNA methyltransferase [Ruminiclostridium sp.]
MQTRLDLYLFDNKIVKSRSVAAKMIKEGKISVNGVVCAKPSYAVSQTDNVEVTGDMPKYVGRGGLKLEKAIDFFRIDLNDSLCVDIGASTGGFTDCMLQSGAKTVYAVDVGSNQLDEKLKADNRVVSMEKTDIRNVKDEIPLADFISIDVSFISLKLVLPSAFRLLKEKGSVVALIKPQFEAGKNNLNKKGIVKDEKVRCQVCEEIRQFSITCGMDVVGITESPISGGDGNIEYLIYLRKGEN